MCAVAAGSWGLVGRPGVRVWQDYVAMMGARKRGDLRQMALMSASLYSCLVDDARTSVTRDEVLGRLHGLRIGAGVHYRPVHQHPWYRRHHGVRTGTLPNAEWVGARSFSLPLTAWMTDEDAADVVRALRHIFG